MNLEQQVTSLELAKHLRELNIAQKSLFYWVISYENKEQNQAIPLIQYDCKSYDHEHIHENYYMTTWSAFTACELLEMLPSWSDVAKRDKNDYIARVFDKSSSEKNYHSFAENAPDALAKMLIHLIEYKLMELKQ